MTNENNGTVSYKLSFNSDSVGYYSEAYEYASRAAARLMNTTAQLPTGRMCVRTCVPGEEGDALLITEDASEAELEDILWIFTRVGKVGRPAPYDGDVMKTHKFVYSLVPGSDPEFITDCEDSEPGTLHDEIRSRSRYRSELFEELRALGAAISVTVCRGLACTALIYLRREMPLRVRSMLRFAFRTETPVLVNSPDDIGFLPPDRAEFVLMSAIEFYMLDSKNRSEQAEKETEEEGKTIEEAEEETIAEMPEDGVSIEDIRLSRSIVNRLLRADLFTVGDVRRLWDGELQQRAHLSRGMIEVLRNRVGYGWSHGSGNAEDPFAQLDGLIGLKDVKEQVRRIAAYARMKRDMEALGRPAVPIVLNMEFTGNPGTAKTTVARILAGIFTSFGILKSADPIEVGRADLVARYEGQTADKVKGVFAAAKGRLLFIDEAYSLVESWNGAYGDEAINTIVQEMENGRDDTVVIFAGYPDEMRSFFERNPGLRSRVPFHISFPDYSAEEMVAIAELEAEKRGFTVTPEALDKARKIFESAANRSGFGNGRFCRNLVENAILGYAARVYGGETEGEKDFAIAAEDIAVPEPAKEPKKPLRIGFAA